MCTKALIEHIHSEMKKIADDVLPADLLEMKLHSISFAGLARLFDILREKLEVGGDENLDLGEIEENSFRGETLYLSEVASSRRFQTSRDTPQHILEHGPCNKGNMGIPLQKLGWTLQDSSILFAVCISRSESESLQGQ
jgi:hypothetical protein